MKQQKFSIKKRMQSFTHAFNGLKVLITEEHNVWIHLLAMCLVIILGFVYNVSQTEWIELVFAIGFVLAMEAVNSAIENLSDHVSPERHELIKKVKDISAAAVLISAVTALVIGLVIFIPKVF